VAAYRYRVVDVFTDTPLEGNPLAVFPDGRGIDPARMQQIARELNLSETVFVLPADDASCARRARIFTPGSELPFAGHPTIGTAYVMVDEKIVATGTTAFCLQEGVGPIAVRLEPSATFMAWLTTPAIVFGETFERAAFARALGLHEEDLCPDVPVQAVSAGVPGVFVAVREPALVDRVELDLAALRVAHGGSAGHPTFVFSPRGSGAYSRMLAPGFGISEDPATGGLTGPLAAFMMRYGLVSHADGTRFVSEQGVKMGRRSLLHVWVHGAQGSAGIEVGGSVAPLAEGQMMLPG
jgi:trans-2,3-dihydro-3-hydroxyanthranilate isomerase